MGRLLQNSDLLSRVFSTVDLSQRHTVHLIISRLASPAPQVQSPEQGNIYQQRGAPDQGLRMRQMHEYQQQMHLRHQQFQQQQQYMQQQQQQQYQQQYQQQQQNHGAQHEHQMNGQ